MSAIIVPFSQSQSRRPPRPPAEPRVIIGGDYGAAMRSSLRFHQLVAAPGRPLRWQLTPAERVILSISAPVLRAAATTLRRLWFA